MTLEQRSRELFEKVGATGYGCCFEHESIKRECLAELENALRAVREEAIEECAKVGARGIIGPVHGYSLADLANMKEHISREIRALGNMTMSEFNRIARDLERFFSAYEILRLKHGFVK